MQKILGLDFRLQHCGEKGGKEEEEDGGGGNTVSLEVLVGDLSCL